MHWGTSVARSLARVVALSVVLGASVSSVSSAQQEELQAFDGIWLYVEDRTEGRAREEQGPPMTVQFPLRVEEDAVVLVRSRGDERITLDGSVIEVDGEASVSKYRGEWTDGVLKYDIETVRKSDNAVVSVSRREFRITSEGLLVRVMIGEPVVADSVALYRHPENIPLPEPAEAKMDDMAWLSGAWVGMRRTSSVEERWSPPRGGAMLGVSRTVRDGSMVAFEFLRIVERDGGLVYVAQPGGGTPTEFVLTEMTGTRAVFDNPRHDYPQRIVYQRSDDGKLTASIGFINGGRPQPFEFSSEEE